MSFQSLVLVAILIVLVGIFFLKLFEVVSGRRQQMKGFREQLKQALGEEVKKIHSGDISQEELDALGRMRQEANNLALKTRRSLVVESFDNQSLLLRGATDETEIPPSPDDLREVPPPEQLGHAPETPTEPEGPQSGPESSAEATTTSEAPAMDVGENIAPTSSGLTEEAARKLMSENASLHGFFRSARVDQNGHYDFMGVPVLLIGNLLAHFRGKSRSNGATEDEKALFIFLQEVMEKRPDRHVRVA